LALLLLDLAPLLWMLWRRHWTKGCHFSSKCTDTFFFNFHIRCNFATKENIYKK